MRKLSVADYFVETLIANGVTEVFGYQGGMIAYIFDSLGKYREKINYHSCGNEQGAALAACAYAQASGKLGVAISTSGPGFTNLLTGMANAWFDSIPVLFVSGNVNTKDKLRDAKYRQNGFQEIQAANMAEKVTKKSIEVELTTDIVSCFSDAISTALSDRMGPVYIDLPINVCREYVEIDDLTSFSRPLNDIINVDDVLLQIQNSKCPVIIAGAGIKQANMVSSFRNMVAELGVPVVTTMPAIDVLSSNSKYNIGYIGGTGRREAGIVLQQADLVISLGTRLCSKQIGHNMSLFAPKANTFIRIDVDKSEFDRKLKPNEIDICANLRSFIEIMEKNARCKQKDIHLEWANRCEKIKNILFNEDLSVANAMYRSITSLLPENANVIFDVGKNLNYGTQSSVIKEQTKVFMSAGLGTMGYSFPAAIGAYLGNNCPTFVFSGDGGAQMNIQELNTIIKNKLPIKIFIFNNHALGNIRLFQENYLESRYVATSEKEGDYFSCDFVAVAKAYGFNAIDVMSVEEIEDRKELLVNDMPVLFNIDYDDCPAYPGIVAGGEYLKDGSGLSVETIKLIKELI